MFLIDREVPILPISTFTQNGVRDITVITKDPSKTAFHELGSSYLGFTFRPITEALVLFKRVIPNRTRSCIHPLNEIDYLKVGVTSPERTRQEIIPGYAVEEWLARLMSWHQILSKWDGEIPEAWISFGKGKPIKRVRNVRVLGIEENLEIYQRGRLSTSWVLQEKEADLIVPETANPPTYIN